MSKLTDFIIFILLICAHKLAYANAYTAQNTYQKLVGDYPFISIASTHVPEQVIETRNITYHTYSDGDLQLDLYQPRALVESDQSAPGVILVHGGGWQAGYRTHLTPIAIELAKAGYVAATISYRLAPEALYPAAIFDTRAAVRWMREHAARYHVNPNQLTLAGSSAGGQIASLTALSTNSQELNPAPRSHIHADVQAIINIDGLSDFTSAAARQYEDAPRETPSSAVLWLGGHYAQATDNWHQASPLFYVTADTPPILFLASGRTRFYVGRDEMIEKLNEHDIYSEVVTFEGTPHSFWLFDPWMKPAADAMVAFLDALFRGHPN